MFPIYRHSLYIQVAKCCSSKNRNIAQKVNFSNKFQRENLNLHIINDKGAVTCDYRTDRSTVNCEPKNVPKGAILKLFSAFFYYNYIIFSFSCFSSIFDS